jgi:hypothetical protein
VQHSYGFALLSVTCDRTQLNWHGMLTLIGTSIAAVVCVSSLCCHKMLVLLTLTNGQQSDTARRCRPRRTSLRRACLARSGSLHLRVLATVLAPWPVAASRQQL